MVCYNRMRDSALFYTDRMIRVIKTPEELKGHLSSDEQVYCVMKSRRYREFGLEAPIVHEIGDDVLITNRLAVSSER
jgi:hypothetical protein